MIHSAWNAWEFPIWLSLTFLISALLYLRGWMRLRLPSLHAIPAWRAGCFFVGLFLIWAAIGSPLAAFDEESLTVHMIQHLLLMTVAPPLIWLGAPLMPFLHGLPQIAVQRMIGPFFRSAAIKQLGKAIAQPTFCWLAAAAALVGWHVPSAFTLALQSEGWHIIEHATFVTAGFLFWWPVVRPWPSTASSRQWSTILYLFLATLPCDILSGFLVFSERIVYPVYLHDSQRTAFSVLADQECAGALMWTIVTVIYLVAGTLLATHLLSRRNFSENEIAHRENEVRPVEVLQ